MMFYTRIFKPCENVDKMYAREKFYVNNPKVILSSMAFHSTAKNFHYTKKFLKICNAKKHFNEAEYNIFAFSKKWH
jgi:alpha-D-ribose 1-methylphosphonate 5-triphosphate diphosphatase PhnM